MFQHFSLKNITTEVIVLTDVMNFFYLLVPVLFHVRQRVVRTYLSMYLFVKETVYLVHMHARQQKNWSELIPPKPTQEKF